MAANTNKPKTPKSTVKEVPEAVSETAECLTQESKAASAPMVVKDIDIHQIVTVRNGFQGLLVYTDKRSGGTYRWENFGDEQDMELGELRNARGADRAFFENNWFLFDEAWIPEYLGMGRYYKYALTADDFDEIFTKAPKEIEATLTELTAGQRKSVAYRARQLIADGTIDSRKVVDTLERCLGVDLVEK